MTRRYSKRTRAVNPEGEEYVADSKTEGRVWETNRGLTRVTGQKRPALFEVPIESVYRWNPDFLLALSNGGYLGVEVKGYGGCNNAFLKMLRAFPDELKRDVAFLVPKDFRYAKGTKQTFCELLEKYGFLWHNGYEIPNEWYDVEMKHPKRYIMRELTKRVRNE